MAENNTVKEFVFRKWPYFLWIIVGFAILFFIARGENPFEQGESIGKFLVPALTLLIGVEIGSSLIKRQKERR